MNSSVVVPHVRFLNVGRLCNEKQSLMDEAYAITQQRGWTASYITEDECLQIDASDRANYSCLYVVPRFEGRPFRRLCYLNYRVYGPQCLCFTFRQHQKLPTMLHPIYHPTMVRLVVCCDQLTQRDSEKIYQKVQWMGGTISRTFDARVTHLVSDNVTSANFKAALSMQKTVVSPPWVDNAWWAGGREPFHAGRKESCDPFRLLPVSQGQSIATSNVSLARPNNVVKTVRANGSGANAVNATRCAAFSSPAPNSSAPFRRLKPGCNTASNASLLSRGESSVGGLTKAVASTLLPSTKDSTSNRSRLSKPDKSATRQSSFSISNQAVAKKPLLTGPVILPTKAPKRAVEKLPVKAPHARKLADKGEYVLSQYVQRISGRAGPTAVNSTGGAAVRPPALSRCAPSGRLSCKSKTDSNASLTKTGTATLPLSNSSVPASQHPKSGPKPKPPDPVSNKKEVGLQKQKVGPDQRATALILSTNMRNPAIPKLPEELLNSRKTTEDDDVIVLSHRMLDGAGNVDSNAVNPIGGGTVRAFAPNRCAPNNRPNFKRDTDSKTSLFKLGAATLPPANRSVSLIIASQQPRSGPESKRNPIPVSMMKDVGSLAAAKEKQKASPCMRTGAENLTSDSCKGAIPKIPENVVRQLTDDDDDVTVLWQSAPVGHGSTSAANVADIPAFRPLAPSLSGSTVIFQRRAANASVELPKPRGAGTLSNALFELQNSMNLSDKDVAAIGEACEKSVKRFLENLNPELFKEFFVNSKQTKEEEEDELPKHLRLENLVARQYQERRLSSDEPGKLLAVLTDLLSVSDLTDAWINPEWCPYFREITLQSSLPMEISNGHFRKAVDEANSKMIVQAGNHRTWLQLMNRRKLRDSAGDFEAMNEDLMPCLHRLLSRATASVSKKLAFKYGLLKSDIGMLEKRGHWNFSSAATPISPQEAVDSLLSAGPVILTTKPPKPADPIELILSQYWPLESGPNVGSLWQELDSDAGILEYDAKHLAPVAKVAAVDCRSFPKFKSARRATERGIPFLDPKNMQSHRATEISDDIGVKNTASPKRLGGEVTVAAVDVPSTDYDSAYPYACCWPACKRRFRSYAELRVHRDAHVRRDEPSKFINARKRQAGF